MEKKDNIVANRSKAYGYSYASLGDIAQQGFVIPKMKTGTEEGREYVFYYDAELKEWIRGAEIVIPNQKGMNEAQMYGSAMTYARRYTTLMALSLACDDDKKLEAQEPKQSKEDRWSGLEEDNLKKMADTFRKVVPEEAQTKILAELKITKAEDLGTVNLKRYIEHYGKKQTDQG